MHRLHSKSTEQAAFVVLKSPSIPSVLVETSFITNPEEERLLGTTAFRQKIANAIASGVISYFNWFDNQKRTRETLMKPNAQLVKTFLMQLQDAICQKLSAADGGEFEKTAARSGRRRRSRVLRNGGILNRPGSTSPTSTVMQCQRPPRRIGLNWRAAASRRWASRWWCIRITRLCQPATPTCAFSSRKTGADPVWWFGGGFDLTPYYGFEEDAVHWHTTARDLCLPFGEDVYPKYKSGAMTISI